MEHVEKLIVSYLAEGNFRLTTHAKERMDERRVRAVDIRECGKTCQRVISQDNGKYRVVGFDLDGDELSVVCVLLDNVLIVTLF